MQLFQIADCNTTLGTCCSSYGVANILGTCLKIILIIQVVAPILLIVMTTVQLIKLIVNPEEKAGNKKIFNKFIAAAIIFFLPIIVGIIMSLVPTEYSFSACYQEAKNAAEIGRTIYDSYIDEDIEDYKSYFSFITGEYEPGEPLPTPTPGDSAPNQWANNGQSSGAVTYNAKYLCEKVNISDTDIGGQMVAYARQFIGQPYYFGGGWNGSCKYTATDCSGFVSGVYSHFGYSIPRTTAEMWSSRYTFMEIKKDSNGRYPVQAGDIVLYQGHVAMLTGSGYEMIHNVSKGITTSPNFSTWGQTGRRTWPLRGVYRIIGVYPRH